MERKKELEKEIKEYLFNNGYQISYIDLFFNKESSEYQINIDGESQRYMTLDEFYNKYPKRDRTKAIKKQLDARSTVTLIEDPYAQPTYKERTRPKEVLTIGIGRDISPALNDKNIKHFKGANDK